MKTSTTFRSVAIRVTGVCAALAISFLAASTRADLVTQHELPDLTMTAVATNGSQGFADIGSPSANTGNINTATTLTMGNLISTGAQAGYFTGLSTQLFGPVAFDPSVPSSISFGNAAFGSFLSTSITEQTNTAGERSFLVLGNYTGGTFGGATVPNPAPSSLTISFTQTPAGTGSISSSASLAIPAVPEPSTIVLATVGIAAGLAMQRARRRGVVRPSEKQKILA